MAGSCSRNSGIEAVLEAESRAAWESQEGWWSDENLSTALIMDGGGDLEVKTRHRLRVWTGKWVD